MGYKIAIVGATGNVGREMLNILAERQFPVDEIVALASRRSLGSEVSFGDTTLTTKDLDTFDFTGWDMALFAVGSEATKKYAPAAAKAGCFNVIPHIDVFMDSGETKEEWKMVAETKKIVDTKIKVTATCVRVPVFVGHSEAVNIEFEDFLDEDEARDILREAPGVMVIDKREDGGYVTPIECRPLRIGGAEELEHVGALIGLVLEELVDHAIHRNARHVCKMQREPLLHLRS